MTGWLEDKKGIQSFSAAHFQPHLLYVGQPGRHKVPAFGVPGWTGSRGLPLGLGGLGLGHLGLGIRLLSHLVSPVLWQVLLSPVLSHLVSGLVVLVLGWVVLSLVKAL